MNLTSIRPIAFFLSLACLAGLLWVNINLTLGNPAPFELSFLHIFLALFPIWAYTIYHLRQVRATLSSAEMAQMDMLGKIRFLLGNPPDWAMMLLGGFYAYALYSLYLFFTGGLADPAYENGQYVLYNHGELTTYTKEEYLLQHQLHLRAITGFFMGFFSISTVALASWRRPL